MTQTGQPAVRIENRSEGDAMGIEKLFFHTAAQKN